jgi:hypothetical protein
MKLNATVAALALGYGNVKAEVYSAHEDNSDIIDKDSSAKAFGLVWWGYFFQIYVEATTVSDPAPTGYETDVHLCWF